MNDHYHRIREILRNHALHELQPEDYDEPVHLRLVKALCARRDGGAVAAGDLAVLLRHSLARESAASVGTPPTLILERSSFWPSEEVLERGGLAIWRSGSSLTLRATAWRPEWLPHSDAHEPGAYANAEERRRTYDGVQGDPFLSIVQHHQYKSAAQREAVRSVLSMPAGSTLVVNLPTGAGKSLCAQLPARLSGEEGGLTVIVVPTTALAIDQERALGHAVNHFTAYYAEEAGFEQRRTGIIDRIRERTQKVVFTSPEGLLGKLRGPVTAVAREGGLRYLVVDEAHMVEQWGDGFRSGFQELGGLRAELLRYCRPGHELRTVLLTATLTAECLSTLAALFKPGSSDFQLLSAVQLRPEPEYWMAEAGTPEEQERWVMEAVYRLPRSLILYVTKPAHAESWLAKLRGAGFRRCACVHGGTPSSQREQVIRQWQAHDIDIVVATSAFGLGMDQGDVKSVIHASVPENIDRYYQEVGRGGRDGRASVALTVYTTRDLLAAKHLNRTTIISAARGRQRWQQMFSSDRRTALGERRYRIPVDTVPSFDAADICMLNERNAQWNVRTLTLMQRAGLIAIDGDIASSAPASEGERVRSTVTTASSRVVKILDQEHLLESTWRIRVEPERRRSAVRDERGFRLMREALHPRRCLSHIFAENYEIDSLARELGLKPVMVAKACGGCPQCRAEGRAPSLGSLPTPLPVWRLQGPLGESLAALLRGRQAAVFYDHGTERRLTKVVWWLASQGLRHVVVSDSAMDDVLGALTPARAATIAPFVTPLSDFHPVTAPQMPSVILIDGEVIPRYVLDTPRASERAPVRVLLMPCHAYCADRPERLLRDVFDGLRFSMSEFQGHLAL